MTDEEYAELVRAAVTNVFGTSALRNSPPNVSLYLERGYSVETAVREWARVNVPVMLDTYFGGW